MYFFSFLWHGACSLIQAADSRNAGGGELESVFSPFKFIFMLNVSCNNLAFVRAANTSRSSEPILPPPLNVILHRGGGVFSLCRWDLMIISADISIALPEWLLWVNSLLFSLSAAALQTQYSAFLQWKCNLWKELPCSASLGFFFLSLARWLCQGAFTSALNAALCHLCMVTMNAGGDLTCTSLCPKTWGWTGVIYPQPLLAGPDLQQGSAPAALSLGCSCGASSTFRESKMPPTPLWILV